METGEGAAPIDQESDQQIEAWASEQFDQLARRAIQVLRSEYNGEEPNLPDNLEFLTWAFRASERVASEGAADQLKMTAAAQMFWSLARLEQAFSQFDSAHLKSSRLRLAWHAFVAGRSAYGFQMAYFGDYDRFASDSLTAEAVRNAHSKRKPPVWHAPFLALATDELARNHSIAIAQLARLGLQWKADAMRQPKSGPNASLRHAPSSDDGFKKAIRKFFADGNLVRPGGR